MFRLGEKPKENKTVLDYLAPKDRRSMVALLNTALHGKASTAFSLVLLPVYAYACILRCLSCCLSFCLNVSALLLVQRNQSTRACLSFLQRNIYVSVMAAFSEQK